MIVQLPTGMFLDSYQMHRGQYYCTHFINGDFEAQIGEVTCF